MSSPVTYPNFKAFDANGEPLAGGLLYTYEAGTDTPMALYEDYAFSTAHDNPIIMDANGEALIYAKAPFKAVLKDSDGVTIDGWPIDNLEFPPYNSYLLIGSTVPGAPAAGTVAMYASGNDILTKGSDGAVNSFITSSGIQTQAYIAADGGGSANVITAEFTPAITALVDKLRVTVMSTAANTGAVTFAPDAMLAKPVVDGGGAALIAGAIAAAAIPLYLQFSLDLDSWVLLNTYPAQYHPSAAKVWCMFEPDGTNSASYNVDTITDNGVGDWTVNITIDFSSALYPVLLTPLSTVTILGVQAGAQAVGSVRLASFNTAGAPTDPGAVYIVCYGDQ